MSKYKLCKIVGCDDKHHQSGFCYKHFKGDARDKYTDHKEGAKRRQVPFLFTFEEWFVTWLASGHWHERGHNKGQYCMARFGDKGPYAAWNVKIITTEENHQEKATLQINYRGTMMTIREAIIAAGNVVSYKKVWNRLRLGWDHQRAVETPPWKRGVKTKITLEQAIAIRNDPRSCRKIAVDYGICPGNVSVIKRRKTWVYP